jgi:hypothetical protein
MPLDAYSPCPGGLNKKVKFCCFDLVHDLAKVQRAIDGDQFAAALDLVEKLNEKFPDRACLLTHRCALLQAADRHEDFKTAAAHFLERFPENPIALAQMSSFTGAEKGIEAGIAQLQDALDRLADNVPLQVYVQVGQIARIALIEGRPLAAIGHLFLQYEMSSSEDEAPLGLLGQIMASPSISVLIKNLHALKPAPEGVPWKEDCNHALRAVARGRWRTAAREMESLVRRYPDAAPLWRNLATLRGWLGDNAGTVAALRALASLNIDFDEAVEAEATAQVLDAEASQPTIEHLTINYALLDIDRLGELLASTDLAVDISARLPRDADQEEPPPRSTFVLLDRPQLKSADELTLENVPRLLGVVSLFGKQTDREARVELMTYRDELPRAREQLAGIAADTIGPILEERVLGTISVVRYLMTDSLFVPKGTSLDRQRELRMEHQRQYLLERWPRVPLPALQGKSAIEAQDDPSARIKLSAAVLLLELAGEGELSDFDFNDLRRLLGLPVTDAIDPQQVDLDRGPNGQLLRVDVKKLTDENLVAAYHRAVSSSLRRFARKLASELVERPDIGSRIDLADVYETLVASAPNSDTALESINQARDWTVKHKQSSAPWDLEELRLRLARGDDEETADLMEHVLREHLREPGVREALAELLYEAGFLGPDGQPRASQESAEQIEAATAGAGTIWTPESEAAAQQKSKLWVPGMD